MKGIKNFFGTPITAGDYMKLARINKGLSLMQLSELTGINSSNIWLYEVERTQPTLPKVELLARTLGITVDEYIGFAERSNK